MKIFAFLLLATTLNAQEGMPKAVPEVASTLDAPGKSVFIIDPKARATDYASAFDFLHKDKPSQKMMVRTTNGVLVNVTDMTPSTEGTLLMIRFLSNQGNKTQIIPVEQIVEIGYSP